MSLKAHELTDPARESRESALDRRTEFMDLVTPNQSRLFGYIYALVHDANDTHDIYQQTVMTLWQKFNTFEKGTNFGAWAMKTAQLECLAFHRLHRLHRQQRCFFDADLVEKLAETERQAQSDLAAARLNALEHCLRKLERKDQSLLSDCYRQGAQIQDVAVRLGRSSQSVCNSLRRLRVSLLECIDRVVAQGGEA